MITTPQSTITFTIKNEEKASPAMKEALKDLPRLAAMVAHDTGWDLSGHSVVNVKPKADSFKYVTGKRKVFDQDILSRVEKLALSIEKQMTNRLAGFSKKKMPTAGFKDLYSNDIMIFHCNEIEDVELEYKKTLYHELVHVAQDQNKSLLNIPANNNANAITHIRPIKKEDKALLKSFEELENQRLEVVEGHAQYLQDKATDEGRITSSGLHNIECIQPKRNPNFINRIQRYYRAQADRNAPYSNGKAIFENAENQQEIDSILNRDFKGETEALAQHINSKYAKPHRLHSPLFLIKSINTAIIKIRLGREKLKQELIPYGDNSRPHIASKLSTSKYNETKLPNNKFNYLVHAVSIFENASKRSNLELKEHVTLKLLSKKSFSKEFKIFNSECNKENRFGKFYSSKGKTLVFCRNPNEVFINKNCTSTEFHEALKAAAEAVLELQNQQNQN